MHFLFVAALYAASISAESAGDRARAAAALARRSPSSSAPTSCLPLLASGTHIGAQYTPPSNLTAANLTNALYANMLQQGGTFYQISLPWADVETTPGSPNFVLVAEILQSARADGLSLLFQLAAIDTEHASVPADLADPSDPTSLRPGLTWNSTVIVDRFATLIEVLAPLAAYSGAVYFGVGNEVDVNLGLRGGSAAYEFAEFLYIFRSYIQQLTSTQLGVGVTFTVGGIGGWAQKAPAWASAIFAIADVTPLTYYPLNADFTVVTDAAKRDRAVGDAIAALPATACIIFQELGMPTGYMNASSTNGSSDDIQAQFFASFATFLSQVNATERAVRGLSLYQAVDMDPDDCAGLARYYNLSAPAFIEYLCTLGAIRADGRQKSGWSAFLTSFLHRNY
jgi:hypothetical protein